MFELEDEIEKISKAILKLSATNDNTNKLTRAKASEAIEILNKRYEQLLKNRKLYAPKETIIDKILNHFKKEKVVVPEIDIKFKNKYEKAINCSKCKCINCEFDCKEKFNRCYHCLNNEHVSTCNKNDFCIVDRDKVETLYVKEFNKEIDYSTKAFIITINDDKKKTFLYLVDECNPDNEQLIEQKIDTAGNEKLISLTEEELDDVYSKYLQNKEEV